MNAIQRHASLYTTKARSVSTVEDCRNLAQDILVDICRLIVTTLTAKSVVTDDAWDKPTGNDDFWMCRTALYMYAVVLLSLLTRRIWIMHGISLLVLIKILGVVLTWADYILDDDELRFASKYVRGWIGLFLREGEKVLSGEAAWKFAMTYSVVTNAPTGVTYLRYVIRYKTTVLRQEFLSELGENRFERRQQGLLQRAISSGSQLQKQLRTSTAGVGTAIHKSMNQKTSLM